MEGLFLRVFTVSAAVSLLLLLLLLCRSRMEKTYSPRTRWGLWLVIALALLIVPWVPKPLAPVVLEAPAYTVTLPARTQKVRPVTPAGEPVQPVVPVSGQHQSEAPAQPEAQVQANVCPAVSGEDQTVGSQPPAVPLTTLLSVLWLMGLALVLLWQGLWYFLTRRRLLREAKPVTGPERCAAKLGLEGRVAFYHCKAVPGPMTLGMWKPVVLLPPDGLAVAALYHELYHVKRHDVAYKVLLLCACALHWFNPLVWILYHWADRDVEACCDAAVVAGQDNGYKRSYGELLLSAAAGSRPSPFTTSFGGGAEQMKARLTQLFHPGKQSRALVCTVLVLAVALGSLVACRQEKTGELADGIYCSPYANVSWPVGETDAEGEDYGSIRLFLLDYNEIDGPHGKPLGEYTLPLSEDLMLRQLSDGEDHSAGEKGTEGWEREVFKLIRWPVYRDMMFVDSVDYLVVTVKNGEITRLSWAQVDRDTQYVTEPPEKQTLTENTLPTAEYHDPNWGFTLHLPASLEGQYYVEKGANYWLFHDKAQSEVSSGFLLGLWAEDSETFRASENPSKVLGEKEGITYSLSTWPVEDMDGVPEERQEAYAAMLRDVSGMDTRSLDLSGVTRSSGYLWPLPYTEYGSDRLLGEGENNTLRILSPEGMTVQSVAGGRVKAISVHPITGEQTVYVVHPDGWNSEYGHLEYVEVKDGAEIKRGEIIGIAREEEGRRWLNFRLLRGSLWDTAASVDPWSVEYRTYDFLPVTRDNVTVAGDPKLTAAMQAVLRGEATFYNVETGEYCYADALPFSDDVPVRVYRFAQLDMDGDTIPEVVLWLQRGDDIYQLGSIILRYQNGWVYGYPMGYRSMTLEALKADGTYGWSGGAFYNGWGRKDFSRNETVNTVWQDYETFYVNGNSVPEETYRRAGEEQEAKPDVEWHDFTEGNIALVH